MITRALAPFVLGLLAVVALAPHAPAQGPLVPTLPWALRDPGPFTPSFVDWNNGNVQVTNPTGGGNITVNHFGVLYFPSSGPGQILPGVTPYPVIVFAHGRFHAAPFIGTNHKQASYLLQHLASWGFVVASVNLDVVGQYGSPAAIPQRGQLINLTVSWLQAQPQYAGLLDFSRIVYIGHSRGGEGVFAAYQQNPAWLASIRAIGAIAPTNFDVYSVPANAFVIYGSQDGDVNNGWPIQLYDQTQTAPSGSQVLKGFRWIEGANHFFFTDSITFAPETNAQLTRAQHHEISRTYWTTWAAASALGDRPSYVRIAGDKEIQWSGAFKLHRIFYNPRQITFDDFEQTPANPGRNTLGGTNLFAGLVGATEKTLNSAAASSYYHKTKGLTGSWNGPAQFEANIAADLDVVGYPFLSVDVLQRYNVASNPFGQPQRFRITLVDANGNSATRDNTDVAPWPYPFTTSPNGPVKSVLKTFRFPLSAFTSVQPLLDLQRIRTARLNFDITPTGELALDGLSFTQ